MTVMRALAALPAGLLLATAVSAQSDDEISLEDLWSRVQQSCTLVRDDPESYLANLPRPGPAGERVVSVTPDEMGISVFYRTGNVYDEVELFTIANRQIRDCAVIGEYYDMATPLLAERIVEIATSTPAVTVTGGQAPQDYGDAEEVYTVDDIFLFAVDGLWPDSGQIAVIHVIGGEVQVMVQFVVAPER